MNDTLIIGAQGFEILKAFETFSPVKYQGKADKPGVWTIGWGHVILPSEQYLLSARLTEAEGLSILKSDCALAEAALRRLVKVVLTHNQWDALVVLVFNIGAGKDDGIKGDFADSTLLALINRGDFGAAAAEFPKWCYSAGVKRVGLLRRRMAEQALFMGKPYGLYLDSRWRP